MKKLVTLILSTIMCVSLLAGCGSSGSSAGTASETTVAAETTTAAETAETTTTAETTEETTQKPAQNTDTEITVYALKGPTGMGMAYLNQCSDAGETAYKYDISYASSADEITGSLISGDIDIAAVPVNLASVLYNKTEGQILTCALDTLGVLYIVTNGTEINSISDLAGKKIVTSGQGSTPEYIINYILEKNGLTDQVEIEYVSEHAEALTQMASGNADIIMVPEPFVTNTLAKVEGAQVALNLTEEWSKVSDTELVQGVLIVQKAFAEEHSDILDTFLQEYAESVDYTNENPADAAAIIESYEIVASAAIAEKAIPNCNIVCTTGQDMADSMSAMLQVLYEANPQSVGGSVPGDEMYYK